MSDAVTTSQAAKIAAIAGQSLQALEAIGAVVDTMLKGVGAVPPSSDTWANISAVLEAIGSAAQAVTKGLNGDVSLDHAEDAIRELRDTLTKNNDVIGAYLNERWPQ